MLFRGKNVEEITLRDVGELVDNRVPESRTLEYKLELPGGKDKDKKEFLADVTSFANTAGGLLLYGVREEKDETGKNTGLPLEVEGISNASRDELIRALGSLIRDGTEPSLTTARLRLIEDDPSRPVLLIGVPRSLVAPHRVSFGGHGHFYRRSTADKYPLGVAELRTMLLESQGWARGLDEFRRERQARLRTGEVLPEATLDKGTLIQVLPMGRLDDLVDIVGQATTLSNWLYPPGTLSGETRPNLDGYSVYTRAITQSPVKPIEGAVQWLRNGGLEVYTSCFHGRSRYNASVATFDGAWASHYLGLAASRACQFMSDRLALDPPYAITLSIWGVKNRWVTANKYELHQEGRFLNEELNLPPILIPDVSGDLAGHLRPLLDILWQSAGYTSIPEVILDGVRQAIDRGGSQV